MRRTALLAFALATTALAGCASDRKSEGLSATLMRYASVIRWGDFTTARSFVDSTYLEDHPVSSVELGRLGQLRVTGYDEGGGPRPDGPDDVVQVVQISVVNLNTQAERSIVDRQRWHYDSEKGTWKLMTGLPDFSPR